MPFSSDFYNRLGLSSEATEDEIRKAFYKAAQRLHPDVNIEVGATELFLEVKEAYDTLIDPEKREAYDRKIGEPPEPPVGLRIDFSQEKISILQETQLFYALLSIEPISENIGDGEKSVPPINLSLILDCSTSMQGERINILKATAVEIIRQLREVDILSVISFNDRAEIILSATDQTNDLQNQNRIRSLQTRGGTEIYQGLKSGYLEVQKNLSPFHVNHVILVTDGHTYGDEENCLELARQAAERNIGISCFGIGSKWNDTFLEALSNITGGSCYYIREPKDIRIFLREKLNDLGQVLIEGIKLSFREGHGVHLNYAYRIEPEAGVLPLSSPLSLGNISKKDKLSFIMEFMILPIPSHIEQVLLFEGILTYNIPENGLISQRFPVNLVRPTKSNTGKESRPSKLIMEALSHLTLYRMQEEAKKEIKSGLYHEASLRLQNIGTHLLTQGETELAKTVFEEVKNLQEEQNFNEENQKRIKYGTKALILPGMTKERS